MYGLLHLKRKLVCLEPCFVYPSSSRTALEEGLEADDFFIEANRRIYHACEELPIKKEHRLIPPLLRLTFKKDTDLLDKSGGMGAYFKLNECSSNEAAITKHM